MIGGAMREGRTATGWNQRFLESTRGRIVVLLRRGPATVDELAQALGLTDNAVRSHLTTLERDGLVQQQGARRRAGKPAYTYGLTPEAESLFPKAYAEVLRGVLHQLARQRGRAELATLLRAVGRDLAMAMGGVASGDSLPHRVEAVAHILGELGGLAEVRSYNGSVFLEGRSCPLRAIVTDYPEACQLALALVQELLATEAVEERCVRGPQPRCVFQIRTCAAADQES